MISKILNCQMPIYVLETKKFKTNLFGFSFVLPLSDKYLKELTILAQAFTKYTKSAKTERELAYKLNNLYDSQIFYNFEKKGKVLQITFYLHVISSKYIKSDTFLKDVFDLFLEVVFEKKDWTNELLQKEIKLYIESLKSKSANSYYVCGKNLLDVMFENESYRLNLDVTSGDVQKITLESLNEAYEYLMNANKFGFVIGDNLSNTLEFFTKSLSSSNNLPLEIIDTEDKNIQNIKFKEVYMNVTQSTLALGYRTNIRVNSKEYFAMCVLNKYLGGGYDSLFINEIREKYNLVYQINSEYDWYKGIMIVNAGINYNDFKLVFNLIEKLITDVKCGIVDEVLFDAVKKQLITEQLDADDNLLSLIEVVNQKYFFEKNTITNEEKIARINGVSADDIINASKKLKLDTVVLVGKEMPDDN